MDKKSNGRSVVRNGLKGRQSERSFSVPVLRARDFISIFLVLAIAAVYCQVRSYGFVSFDDQEYVVENDWIASGSILERIDWAVTAAYSANWHPLTWASHMLDVQWFGLAAGEHHLHNLLLHAGNSLLLFFVLMRMTGCRWRSGFVAAMFAIHPINVETVAWVSQRKSLLSTLFMMLMFWFYAGYVQHKRRSDYGWAFLWFVMGLLSKPMIVTAPFVLLLLDYWPFGRLAIKEKAYSRLLWEKLPFFLAAIIICFVTLWAQRSAGALAPLTFVAMGERFANVVVAYVRYIAHMVWPFHLSVFYPLQRAIPSWKIIGALSVLGIATIVSFRQSRRQGAIIVGWLWFLGTLVPVIGLVQVGSQSMADRYAYIPMIGLFIMMAWAIPDFTARDPVKRMWICSGVVALVVGLMVLSWGQTRYWQNSATLFRRVVCVTPESAMGHYNLALSLENKGELAPAIDHYREAIRLNPGHIEARMNLGLILSEAGKLQEAIRQYVKAYRMEPENPKLLNNMGMIYADAGQKAFSLRLFREALRISPLDAEIHNNIGVVLFRTNRVEDAIFHMKTALRIHPDYKEAKKNLKKMTKQ